MTALIDGGLRAMFRSKISGHWQSVETGSTSQGVPDANYCVEGSEGWVEFKQTKGWAVSFKIGQVPWIMRRSRAGGRVWVAVRRWPTPVSYTQLVTADELWMVPGPCVEELARHGLREVQVQCMIAVGGPRKWDWDGVRRLLTGPL